MPVSLVFPRGVRQIAHQKVRNINWYQPQIFEFIISGRQDKPRKHRSVLPDHVSTFLLYLSPFLAGNLGLLEVT